jgi:hypothetical protein
MIGKTYKEAFMGYIKDPPGVDFFIKSRPLTPSARKAISSFIQASKEKSGLLAESPTQKYGAALP